MPALLERPKLSSAMARALHRHVMVERERKRQEEEEVDKMMEQKMKEEQERRRKKEMEERMSLEETKEQICKLGERLQALQEEKHQLFLQLKKVLHEEEKRRRKEQSDLTTLTAAAYQQGMVAHAGTHILNMQGSPGGHSRAGTLISADRSKQIFAPPVITTRHFATQPAFAPGTPEHGQYQSGQAGHSPYAVGQGQHFAPGQAVPVSYAGSQPIRGPSAFPAMQYLSQQPPGFALHGHFPPAQPGFIPPSTTIPLQKQLEHANQQSGFTDSATLRPMHPQALHPNQTLLPSPQIPVQMQPASKSGLASPGSFPHGSTPQQPHTSGFPASGQPASRHPFIQHAQGQRFYHK
ncbi:G protein pathway suppressor 2 isoform X1 [Gopherus flavomarginatus]|uniref:G protein pathway suppressor 2 isoform X1 n=1 Tax=Gopherus flavomarginatus TaxID=286002 RepID=UPI0021CC15C6|nr:G protein pathway suppressor 2 isoform X1 [Gopherus flavomarginatus]